MERGIRRTFRARIASRSVFAPTPLMERAVFASITISTVYCPPVLSVLGVHTDGQISSEVNGIIRRKLSEELKQCLSSSKIIESVVPVHGTLIHRQLFQRGIQMVPKLDLVRRQRHPLAQLSVEPVAVAGFIADNSRFFIPRQAALLLAVAVPLCLAQKLVQPLVFALALRYTGDALLCG